jgi:hypothetical protein
MTESVPSVEQQSWISTSNPEKSWVRRLSKHRAIVDSEFRVGIIIERVVFKRTVKILIKAGSGLKRGNQLISAIEDLIAN